MKLRERLYWFNKPDIGVIVRADPMLELWFEESPGRILAVEMSLRLGIRPFGLMYRLLGKTMDIIPMLVYPSLFTDQVWAYQGAAPTTGDKK